MQPALRELTRVLRGRGSRGWKREAAPSRAVLWSPTGLSHSGALGSWDILSPRMARGPSTLWVPRWPPGCWGISPEAWRWPAACTGSLSPAPHHTGVPLFAIDGSFWTLGTEMGQMVLTRLCPLSTLGDTQCPMCEGGVSSWVTGPGSDASVDPGMGSRLGGGGGPAFFGNLQAATRAGDRCPDRPPVISPGPRRDAAVAFAHRLSLWHSLVTPPGRRFLQEGEGHVPAFTLGLVLGTPCSQWPAETGTPGTTWSPALGLRAERLLPRAQLFSLWHQLLKFPAAWPHTAGGKDQAETPSLPTAWPRGTAPERAPQESPG